MDKNCVLLPVRPRWCENISYGRKTDEIRKNQPKLNVPFKCYLYETKEMWGFPVLRACNRMDLVEKLEKGKGKVIGEFVCNEIQWVDIGNMAELERTSCVSFNSMWKYAKPKSIFDLRAWHISDLKIYDKPKELSEFGLSRAPQSWCYVKEVA